MKSGRPHRVPLSPQALQVLSALDRFEDEALIFPGRVVGRPLSESDEELTNAALLVIGDMQSPFM
jgi:integrase